MIQPDLYAQDTLTGDPDELKEDAAPATTATDGLRCFVEAEVLPWFETRTKELANRPLICTRRSARCSTPGRRRTPAGRTHCEMPSFSETGI